MTEINLSNKNLNFVPKGLSKFNIEVLDLSNNLIKEIREIPENVEQLDLSDNYIQIFELGDTLEKLEILDLSNNEIVFIEYYIPFFIENLKVLDLSNNDLAELPSSFSFLKLEELRIDLDKLAPYSKKLAKKAIE